MLLLKFPSGPFETNAILFGCTQTKKAAVIDPSAGSTESVLLNAKGFSIERILLTHSHWDHIADVAPLKEKTAAPVFVHPLDAGNLGTPGQDRIPLFIPIQGVKADGFLEDGMHFEVGLLRVEVIHTPGHSPGSVCLYLPEQKILFSGDTLFHGTIGNLHLPTGQPAKMGPSLRKLASLPADTKVIPGHGRDTTIGAEHWVLTQYGTEC